MTEERIRPLRLTLTLRQMMKLVIFAAVASMCLAPMWRLAEIGAVSWPFAILMEAMGIPLVLALVAFPMVRKGPHKDRLVRALLLTSLGVGLGAAIYSLVWASAGPPSLNIWASSGATVGFVRWNIVLLGIPFVILLRQVVRGWCPACRRSPLLPVVPADLTPSMRQQMDAEPQSESAG